MTIKPQRPPQTEINSVIALYSNGQIQEALDSIETLTKDYPNEPLLYNNHNGFNETCTKIFHNSSKLD